MGELQDPPAQPNLATLNANIAYLLLGVYGWEYLGSLHVEWALICGQLAFRATMIPYILGRTCLLIFLILFTAGTSPYSQGISCIPGTMALGALGDIALGCSSTNFLIRTWVIWKDSRWVHALLLFLALGQLAVLVEDVAITHPVNVNGVCEVYLKYPRLNAATFIYTTFFDSTVFVLSVVGLSSQRCESPLTRRLRLQAILYIAVAGISYIPPIVSLLLGNFSVYFLLYNTAITLSTIVSSKAVRSLYALGACDPCGESNVALTTQIEIQRTMFLEDIPTFERSRVAEVEVDRW
ncbi:hypothetical protein V8E55_009833 [Tylopilus felleus]|jgi:hypothetical protein